MFFTKLSHVPFICILYNEVIKECNFIPPLKFQKHDFEIAVGLKGSTIGPTSFVWDLDPRPLGGHDRFICPKKCKISTFNIYKFPDVPCEIGQGFFWNSGLAKFIGQDQNPAMISIREIHI